MMTRIINFLNIKTLVYVFALPIIMIQTYFLMMGLAMFFFPLFLLFLIHVSLEISYPQPIKGFILLGITLSVPLSGILTFYINDFLDSLEYEFSDKVMNIAGIQGFILILLSVCFGEMIYG